MTFYRTERTHAGSKTAGTAWCLMLLLLSLLLSASAMAVALQDYTLSAGDKIRIHVYGEDDLTIETLIADTGVVSYPFLGVLQVKGLTAAALEDRITRGLKGRFLIDPEVTVAILEYRQFYVNGFVQSPGGFAFQPGMTVRKAISLAGGFKERANKQKISVVRADDPAARQLGVGLDHRVRPGDTITIERSFF